MCNARSRLCCAQGGLPGLLLRLAADGHGALEVVGPPGTAAFVQAAAAFVKWVHPKARAHARRHAPARPAPC